MLKRSLLLMLVALMVCGCQASGGSGIPPTPSGFWQGFFANLDIIFSHSGIAGVILVFWFFDRVWTNRLIGKLNGTITTALNNNTAAMAGLAATLQTGCPAIYNSMRLKERDSAPQTGHDRDRDGGG